MEAQRDSEQLKKELEVLLKELGYDMSNKDDKKVFVDVVVETMECIGQGMSKEEVFNLVHNKNGFIYVELAYFCYEQGMVKLHSSLENFHQGRNEKSVNRKVYDRVFSGEKNPTVFDSAYYVASYLEEKKKQTMQDSKPKQKVKTVN
mgnify:CR=1 FL=1